MATNQNNGGSLTSVYLLLAVALLLGVLTLMKSDRIEKSLITEKSSNALIQSYQQQLFAKELQVNTLTLQNQYLEEKLADCNSDLQANVTEEAPPPAKKTTTRAAAPVVKKAPAPVVQQAPAPPVTKKVVSAAPVASREEIYTLPSYFYESGTKGVIFCIRLGGQESRHLPALAISQGMINVEDNGIGGSNWVVDGAVSDLVGDWGVTRDGTFFVSAKLIEAFLTASDNGIVELKAPATSWVPKQMTKIGDYYTFRATR